LGPPSRLEASTGRGTGYLLWMTGPPGPDWGPTLWGKRPETLARESPHIVALPQAGTISRCGITLRYLVTIRAAGSLCVFEASRCRRRPLGCRAGRFGFCRAAARVPRTV